MHIAPNFGVEQIEPSVFGDGVASRTATFLLISNRHLRTSIPLAYAIKLATSFLVVARNSSTKNVRCRHIKTSHRQDYFLLLYAAYARAYLITCMRRLCFIGGYPCA